jgi:hypothetical protein
MTVPFFLFSPFFTSIIDRDPRCAAAAMSLRWIEESSSGPQKARPCDRFTGTAGKEAPTGVLGPSSATSTAGPGLMDFDEVPFSVTTEAEGLIHRLATR